MTENKNINFILTPLIFRLEIVLSTCIYLEEPFSFSALHVSYNTTEDK
jgi:hypothetical protein